MVSPIPGKSVPSRLQERVENNADEYRVRFEKEYASHTPKQVLYILLRFTALISKGESLIAFEFLKVLSFVSDANSSDHHTRNSVVSRSIGQL